MEQTHSTEPNHTIYNWVLAFFVGLFTAIEQASADEIYTWIFRGLSLLSLSLIIIINWQKAMNVLFPKKN